ncbi:MAG TPA: flagellar motor protein [Armatimonadota bacterium]|nr:flagellar motor protein [Armatimonadota bacterium]HPP75633.1 flagellar motor protein [Armatimonadota bacterium]
MTSKKAPVNMDLATVIGLLLAWGALLIALFMEGGSISDLINPSALIIVVGGTIGATTVAFSMKQILGLPAIIRNAFFSKETDLSQVIYRMVVLARKARQDGILALEEESRRVNNKFLKMGIRLVVDGVPSEMVREILETETISLQERHKVGENIFATMGGFAPTMGIIGTVMGLIHMLSSLDEPGKMGPAIAAAFIATLYGVALANLVFLPIGSKLKARTTEEIIAYDMMLEGILSIQAGDNPRMVETKMLAFLPPKQRELLGTGRLQSLGE